MLGNKTIKIFGPPGTGKTTTLLNRLDKWFNRGITPKEIAYLSFTNKAVNEAREYLYRTTFGLNPRKGTNIFKKNKDGTLSFNPKSERGQMLIDEIKMGADMLTKTGARGVTHGVMGGYSWKLKGGKIHYEDIWDFKMHPSEWKDIFHTNVHLKGWERLYPYGRQDLIKQAGLRTLVDLITTSPVIKGTVPAF